VRKLIDVSCTETAYDVECSAEVDLIEELDNEFDDEELLEYVTERGLFKTTSEKEIAEQWRKKTFSLAKLIKEVGVEEVERILNQVKNNQETFD
jgi:hypothetical protein